MDPEVFEGLVKLCIEHRWVAGAAFAIGLIIRLGKAGKLGGWMADIPPKLRPVLAVALGAVAAICEVIASGGNATTAIVHGVLAAAIAVLGHDVVIEGMRDGREIGSKK